MSSTRTAEAELKRKREEEVSQGLVQLEVLERDSQVQQARAAAKIAELSAKIAELSARVAELSKEKGAEEVIQEGRTALMLP